MNVTAQDRFQTRPERQVDLDAACAQVRHGWKPAERRTRALIAQAAQRRLMSLLLMRDADALVQAAAQSPKFAG